MTDRQSNDEPLVQMQIDDPADLLTETFKWEAATILACARLGVNRVDISESRVPRAFVQDMLDQLAENPLQRSPRITDRFMQLYSNGVTLSEISTVNFSETLRSSCRISSPLPHMTLIIDIPNGAAAREICATPEPP